MHNTVMKVVGLLLLGAFAMPAQAGDVAIYTGDVGWIDKASADTQAQNCVNALTAAGITNQWFPNSTDKTAVADWVTARTNNGALDVLVLYGYFPETIYPGGNAMPNGSIAELFIESADGDMILNHADYMFYVSNPFNNDGGLMNMMDLPAITMWDDNIAVAVTPAGTAISPSLLNTQSDRPFHINELAGDWYVEAALALNGAATRADPIIVRDGNRGRLAMAYQTPDDAALPRGVVAAEMITYLMQRGTAAVALSGASTTVEGTPVRFTVSLVDENGILMSSASAVTVNLAEDSATGAFDTAMNGAFSGTVTSVTIPAGGVSAKFYYKDTAAALVTLSATATGLAGSDLQVNVIENVPAGQGEAALYTGNVGWTDKATADAQAAICIDKLTKMGITTALYASDADKAAVATWVQSKTNNGERDVLILYGYFPETIYAAGNTEPDGSIAELFIESTDGDTIINHADYMFYVTTPCCNGDAALMNMMDTPGVNMWDDWRVTVTAEGKEISPSLAEYQGAELFFWTARPLHVDLLANDWFVEAALAESTTGTRAEPVIVRDGNRGRLIPIFQYANRNDPKGAVAAEIIAWLSGIDIGTPVKLGLAGTTKIVTGRALKLTVQIQDVIGTPSAAAAATTVNLTSTSATGAFDTSPDGSFDGSVTSVAIAEGESSAVFYYKNTTAGTPTVTAAAPALTAATLQVTVVARTFAPPGDVAIFTGNVNWIDKSTADAQAQICQGSLIGAGVNVAWFNLATDEAALASWVASKTNNGELDVLVLYGFFPGTLYPPQNAMPDGSVAELFIESPDGDVIMNHADWMFYMNDLARLTDNGPGGLQNMMDIPTISMDGGDNPMVVTSEGKAIAPHLGNHLSDRPFHANELAGDWIVEAALAQDASGTRVDPCVVRDGPRGRLISMFQSDHQADPIGPVSAEVIAWLMGKELGPTELAFFGSATTVTGTPALLRVTIQDAGGITFPSAADVAVNLTSTSATGAFDTAFEGAYDGSVTSVAIPAGSASATFYYVDTAAAAVTLTARAAGLTDATMGLNVIENVVVEKGEVAIYTGATSWIPKADADAEALICIDALTALDIATTSFASPVDGAALADWVIAATNNGTQDVLVLYGYLPTQIYPAGNTSPDGSIAELFIESTDGDAIINHGDWMFYVSGTLNGTAGLENMMDITGISMAGDNTSVVVTDQGAAIAPSLADFLTDRPFHTNELAGNWFVEAALAQDATGTRVDPCVVRDGNQGRLIPVYQTMNQADPKGAVAAEIIAWLMEKASGMSEPVFKRGDANTDGKRDIADAIKVLGYLFGGGTTQLDCLDAGDGNDDGKIDIADAIKILGHLFAQTGPLPAPFDACDVDPTEDVLGCERFAPCGWPPQP